MESSSKQNASGRAFEYAVLKALLIEARSHGLKFDLQQTNASIQAEKAFQSAAPETQSDLLKAAAVGVQTLVALEPRITHAKSETDALTIMLQNDSAGQAGDVRDLVAKRVEQSWEVGISAKHNSKFIKSARLSNAAKFGQSWLQVECSQTYIEAVQQIFEPIAGLRGKTTWNEFGKDSKHKIYGELVEAFRDELLLLYSMHGACVPENFMKFLLGNTDFYKILRIENTTQVQPFNIYGSLGQKAGAIKTVTKMPKLPLPSRILSIDKMSETTLHLYCDRGWQVSLRVHNKDDVVSHSLGLEVQLIGHPSELFTLLLPWTL